MPTDATREYNRKYGRMRTFLLRLSCPRKTPGRKKKNAPIPDTILDEDLEKEMKSTGFLKKYDWDRT